MTTLQELIEHQNAIHKTHQRIEAITKAMAEQRRIIESTEVDTTELEALEARRKKLETAVLIGEAKPSDVDAITRRIEKARQAIEEQRQQNEAVRQKAANALADLERELIATKERLAKLTKQGQDLLRNYLRHMAEEVAREYVKTAYQTAKLYAHLRALEGIAGRYGDTRRLIATEITLPVPRMAEFDKIAWDTLFGVLLNENAIESRLREEAKGDILKRIAADKVDLELLGGG